MASFFIRLFSFLLSLIILIVLSPFLIFITLMIKRDSAGPVFFHSIRIGKDGKQFKLYKFRTMREEPASYAGPRITAHDDNRITPLGTWLRKTKINELPNFWNVLKGDMNVVGPRPEDPAIVETWPKDIRQEILSVRPGITSPASVVYRQEEKLLSQKNVEHDYLINIVPDKLRLDQLYVRNRSVLSDMDVLFWTVIALFPPLARSTPPENTLFVGPFSQFIHRYFSWFIIDILTAVAAIGIVGLIWRASGPLDLGIGIALGIAAVAAFLFSLINTLLGLGRISWKQARPFYVFDIALSVMITTMILFVVNLYWPGKNLLPPSMVIVFGIIAFLAFVIVRYRTRLFTGLASRWVNLRGQAGAFGERILIIGAGECGQLANWLIGKSRYSSVFHVVGMVDDNPNKQGMKIDGLSVLGGTKDIPELVSKKDIGVIMYSITRIKQKEQERIIKLCAQTPARLVMIPDLLNILETTLFNRTATEAHDEPVVE